MSEMTKDPVVERLASKGRHYKISVIVITQHPQKLDPAVRSNADIAAVFRLHSSRALNTLAEDYLPGLDHKSSMDVLTTYSWKDKKTKQAQALIVVNREGNTLGERLFTYVAPEAPPFQIGCREYCKFIVARLVLLLVLFVICAPRNHILVRHSGLTNDFLQGLAVRKAKAAMQCPTRRRSSASTRRC